MKISIYDLTHLMHSEMLLFPGTPAVKFESANTVAQNGFAETNLTFTSHVGTHLDAPAHLIDDGRTLDQFLPDTYWGQAFFVDCQNCGEVISREHLQNCSEDLAACDFAILVTGHSARWPTPAYLHNFPVLTIEAVKWLGTGKYKAIGIDAVSVDPLDSTALPNHHFLLKHEILIIENMKIPERLIGKKMELILAPLYFYEADGAPVRIFARGL